MFVGADHSPNYSPHAKQLKNSNPVILRNVYSRAWK